MAPGTRQGIDKAMRLRRRRDFLAVQASGSRIHGRAFLALVSPSRLPAARVGRVGLTVTRRIGNAVTRNRIKRLVREWLRLHGWVPAGWDVVLVAKAPAAEARRLADVAGDLAAIQARIATAAPPSASNGVPC